MQQPVPSNDTHILEAADALLAAHTAAEAAGDLLLIELIEKALIHAGLRIGRMLQTVDGSSH